jgi:TonB family protein
MHRIHLPRPLLGLGTVLALALAVPHRASGQTIAGLVIDSITHRPARLLAVQVIGDSGRTVADTRTDTAGVFYAWLSKAGAYRLRFALDSTGGVESDTIRVPTDGFVERQFLVSFPRAYFEFEVEKQVQTAKGSPQPRYPGTLRTANIEGGVLVQFVVDTTGRAEASTFKVLKASHPEFIFAVKEVLPRMRFYPAELRGHKVKQMVQQPFEFRLDRNSSILDEPPSQSLFPSQPRQSPWP